MNIHDPNISTPKVTTGPITGSRKIHTTPQAAPDLRVPLKEIALDPKSGEANKLANFVLTRISDFRLYNLYQSANFDAGVPKKLILEILQDSAAYEVPAG